MNGLLIFLIYGIAHLMARGAESQRIGFRQSPIEATPEQNSPNTAKDDQGRKREPPTRAPKDLPYSRDGPLQNSPGPCRS